MMYAVYDDEGRITQAGQDYSGTNAAETIMRDLGQRWIKEPRELVSSDYWYVRDECLTERPLMPAIINKRTIKAGGNDSAVIVGIPKGASCTISTGGNTLHDLTMDENELEVLIPVPCIYTVTLRRWPFQDKQFQIEAVA